ncbi:hypothetical protein AM1BK_43390 [Neobacillus kokaensis]|uniref:Secreted protein n=1 Tax=Neobacillus kokaensis TaxID=2759023 RepID=A0ABQ3NAV6_9BACI|nr:hypothetical protein AM1BK_43390 [Neobacillus kokaensis]
MPPFFDYIYFLFAGLTWISASWDILSASFTRISATLKINCLVQLKIHTLWLTLPSASAIVMDNGSLKPLLSK